MEEPIDLNETLKIKIEHDHSEFEKSATTRITFIVTSLVDVTRKANTCLGGMIMITYTNCLFLATISLYLTSSMAINRYQGIELIFIALSRILMAILSITRLFFITSFGQGLTSIMRKCGYTIKKNQINHPCSDKLKSEKFDLIYQLLKDNSHSPITPISAFSLSNRTLLGIIATILTYLVVLIRFKACKNDRLDFFDSISNRNLSIDGKN